MSWHDFKILSQDDIDAFKHCAPVEGTQFKLGESVGLNLNSQRDGKECIVQVRGVIVAATFGPHGSVHYDIAFPIAPGYYARVSGLRGWITKPGEHPLPGGGLTLIDDLSQTLTTLPFDKPKPNLTLVENPPKDD